MLLINGCSQKAQKVGDQVQDVDGLKIELTSDPDPPRTGVNNFYVRLTDDSSASPVVNANVTISAFNDLAGGGDRESGRSQGDGSYRVPITLGIPDDYKLDVEVQRPQHDDADVEFLVTAQQGP